MLIPVINYDNPPPEKLMPALMHFEARCQMRGITRVDAASAQAFLSEEYPEVADLFDVSHLRPA